MPVRWMDTSVMSTLIRSNANCTCLAPTSFKSSGNAPGRTSQFVRPVRNTLFLAPNLNPFRRIAILTLLFRSSPAHISGFVMSFVIRVTVERMSRCQATTDYCQKLFKRLKTKFNALCSIIFIISCIERLTSRFCTLINCIFRGKDSIHSFPVLGVFVAALFKLPTSARTMSTTSQQIIARHGHAVTAFTETVPCRMRRNDSCIPNNKKVSKSLAYKTLNFRIYLRWIMTNGKLVSRHFVKDISFNNLASRVARILNSFQPAFIITNSDAVI